MVKATLGHNHKLRKILSNALVLNLIFGLQTKDTRFEIYRPWDSAVACDQPNFISGSYQSCGSKFRVWNGNYIEVQPGDGVYKAYDVHQFPRIQWHAAKSELDSLIVYDVGNLYVHGIYVNIVHGEISSGQVRVTGSKNHPKS